MTIGTLNKIALTPQEVADLCGLHINTVRKLIADKKIPAVHLSRKILVSKAGLLRWLEGQSNPPAAPTGTAM